MGRRCYRGAAGGRDNGAMHLLIPFAAPLSESGRQAAATLQLPHLQELLARWREVHRDEGDAWNFSPPHERALAQALGLQGGSGLLPWAAHAAQADGIATGGLAWALVTPAHWHLGTDQVSLLDPAGLLLDEHSARSFFEALRTLFAGDGYALHYAAPLRWYAAHDSFTGLATASLDRVIGRNVDAWLGSAATTRRVRRLQSESQMLLHTHPLNDERGAQGLLPVNSFWLSGCGVAQVATGAAPAVDARLRAPALAEDWAAWVKAWDTLDAGPLRELLSAAESGQPCRLTLCGERSSASFESASRGLLQRLRSIWSPPAMTSLLESL
jgi:hypothetical protein